MKTPQPCQYWAIFGVTALTTVAIGVLRNYYQERPRTHWYGEVSVDLYGAGFALVTTTLALAWCRGINPFVTSLIPGQSPGWSFVYLAATVLGLQASSSQVGALLRNEADGISLLDRLTARLSFALGVVVLAEASAFAVIHA